MSQKTFPHENLELIKSAATKLSPWAHLATVGKDNRPDVVPVHPCWEGDVLWVLVGNTSVKSKNIAHNNHVAFHWQVTESGDGVEVWGTATVHSDVETKKHLWNGVFDYDLNAFAPGGPENSPDTGFMRIEPYRAIYLPQYGMGGRTEWRKA